MTHLRDYGQQSFSVRPQFPSQSQPACNHSNEARVLEKTRHPIFRGYVNGQSLKYPPPLLKSEGDSPSPPPILPKKQRQPFQVRFAPPIKSSGTPSSSRETSVSLEDGPPIKRQRRNGRGRSKPTRLTTRKPVISEIHMDAWKLIFEFCEPFFLLYVIRPLCREFHEALNAQDIWRKSRLNYFGEDMPDCPSNLTEQQYVNLLVGRGCQSPSCDRRETRKVYWPFMVRLCDSCFRQATSTHDSSPESSSYSSFVNANLSWDQQSELGRMLLDLVPAGLMESGRYMGPRRLLESPTRWERSPMQTIVLNRDLHSLKVDFRNEELREQPDILAWAKDKWHQTKPRMKIVNEIHQWEQHQQFGNGDLRYRRREFFQAKARQMKPPMTIAILNKMVAFHNALATANAPSERSWTILHKKIDDPNLRKQAEQLVQWEHSWLHGPDDLSKATDILQAHRAAERYSSTTLPKELELILEIAQEEFDNLNNRCHDQDLLLLCLRNVRRAYERLKNKPIGLNSDLSRGPYRLCLMDARMIVEEIIAPGVGPSTNRGKEVLELFRCIGCTRTDCTKTRDFKETFEHINMTHARFVGEGSEFYRLAEPTRSAIYFCRRVAWLQLPWYKNMPMLPAHQKVTTSSRWDPDFEQEYIEFSESGTGSAFSHRKVKHNPNVSASDFPANFAYAAELLRPTRLDGPTTTKIALRYAVDRFRTATASDEENDSSSIPLSNLAKAIEKARLVNAKLNFKFRCGACVKDKSGSKHTRQVRSAVAFHVLEDHWTSKHQSLGYKWEDNLMDLPSDVQVLDNMLVEDDKLREEQEKCRLREAALIQVPSSKRADWKASALLEMRPSVAVFGQLFTKDNEEN